MQITRAMPGKSALSRTMLSQFLVGASATAISQVAIQAIGFLVSVIVIRQLVKEEFALYTIALSIVGAIASVSDAGLASNAMAQCGRFWPSDRVGDVLATAARLRMRLALSVMALVVPGTAVFLSAQAFSLRELLLLMCAVSFLALVQTPVGLMEVPLKLRQDLGKLLMIRLGVNISRSLALVATLAFAPFAWALLTAAALCSLPFNALLAKVTTTDFNQAGTHNDEHRKEMISVVKKSLPGSVYYAVQSQANVWILAAFGGFASVADLGALGRLTMVFALFSTVFETVAAPRIAKFDDARAATVYARVCWLGLISVGVVAALVFHFADLILLLLGQKYHGLESELSTLFLAMGVGMVGTFAWSMNNVRAAIAPWYIYPSIGIATYLICWPLFGFESVLAIAKGTLFYAAVSLVANVLVYSRCAAKRSG